MVILVLQNDFICVAKQGTDNRTTVLGGEPRFDPILKEVCRRGSGYSPGVDLV